MNSGISSYTKPATLKYLFKEKPQSDQSAGMAKLAIDRPCLCDLSIKIL
jgi:hypothetical protein